MEISWSKFSSNNPNKTESFQALANYIFSEETGAKVRNAPKNYPGLETKPTKGSDGLIYGYQAKFFESAPATSQKSQLKDAMQAISVADQKVLDGIKVYVSEAANGVQTETQTELDKIRTKLGLKIIVIDWMAGISSYQIKLGSSDYYAHIKAIFFNGGNPSKLHSENVPNKTIAELFSKPYHIELPLTKDGKSISIETVIKDRRSKTILIKARAGAGKSKLLQYYSYIATGLDQDDTTRRAVIIKDGVTLRFNAHEFIGKNPRDLIASRLDSYEIQINDYSIKLLVDSLDEINEFDAKQISQHLKHLIDSGIVRQLISCSREASKNSIIFEGTLEPTIIHIEKLGNDKLLEYFKARKVASKTKLLNRAIKDSIDIELLRDIRMLELTWNVVTHIDDFNKAVVMEKRLKTQIDYVDTTATNLLSPQEKRLEYILEEQGYKLQKRGGFDFEQSQLQRIIDKQNPKLLYSDINEIIRVLKDICIENVKSDEAILQFEHRSWADYFAARYLAKNFSKDNMLIVGFTQYEDFLKEWFIPVARSIAKSKDNFVNSIVIGIIEYYLLEYLDRTNPYQELLVKLNIAKYHPARREQIKTELEAYLSSSAATPSIALASYNAGYVDIARRIHDSILKKLDADDKDSYQLIYEQLRDFYALQIIFKKQSLARIYERAQANAYLRTKADNFPTDKDGLNGNLIPILNLLVESGLSLKDILRDARKGLRFQLFAFFSQPHIARQIFVDDDLKNSLVDFYKGNTVDKVAIQGIFTNEFTKKQKLLAQKYLDELHKRDNFWLRDVAYDYNIRAYAYKRILGFAEWESSPYNLGGKYEVLSGENIFERIYYFTVIRQNYTEINLFTKWLADAPIYNRTIGSNYEYVMRTSSTIVMTDLMITLPYQSAQKLYEVIKSTDNGVVNFYNLVVRIYAHDEQRFSSLFSKVDIIELIDKSRESLEDYVSSISDLGGIIAVFEPQRAMTLLYELQRETRLRYGYHKDYLGYFMSDALKLMWSERLYDYEGLVMRTKSIYDTIMDIEKITDGSGMYRMLEYFFETIIKYDMRLAEEFYKRYSEDDEEYSVGLLTMMLKARISRGDSFQDISNGVYRYRQQWMDRNRVFESYYEYRFIIWMEIVNHQSFYTLDERIDALKKAGKEVQSLLDQQEEKWKYHPSNSHDDGGLIKAIKLYRKYKRELGLITEVPPYPQIRKDSSSYVDPKQPISKDTTKTVILESNTVDSLKEIINSIVQYNENPKISYKHLLYDRSIAQIFIAKLSSTGVPFVELIELINRCLSPWSYGDRARNFVFEVWNSPYRLDLRSYMMSTTHHVDVSTIMEMLLDTEDTEEAKELIDEVISFMKVLTRPTNK